MLRGKAIEHLVNAAAQAFIDQQPALLAGELQGDLVEHMPPAARNCVLTAKDMARKRIFQDKRKTLHEIGAYSTLETLLDAFCSAVNELHAGQNLSFKHQRILDLIGHTIPQADWLPYRSYLRVLDFIAGMTDLYAADMAAQIRGINPA